MENQLRYHFIAIGGAAMHNLALALHDSGHLVTGSDDEVFEPSLSRLKAKGLLPDTYGWFPEKITSDISAVILGMHAREDNPELIAAKEKGIPVFSFPEFIFEKSKNKQRIVIAGSHGKTTITAIILHVLKHINKEVDFLVGAQIAGFDNMVRLSETAPTIIIEGDEYFASPLDKQPKFLKYQHHIALVSGVSWDHINVYPTLDNYVRQFDKLADATPKGGILIYNEEDDITSVICKKARTDVWNKPYKTHAFEIIDGISYLKTKKAKYPIRIFGDHNISNISGAYELLTNCLGVTDDQFYEAIQTFPGAANRLETIASKNGAHVIKDFAHAPSKVVATTKAVKKQFGSTKLIACLELHTFSSLNADFIPQYENTMKVADVAFVYFNPGVLSAKQLPALDKEVLAKAFKSPVRVFTDIAELEQAILAEKSGKANLLLMSSGNFHGLDYNSLAINFLG